MLFANLVCILFRKHILKTLGTIGLVYVRQKTIQGASRRNLFVGVIRKFFA